MNKLTNIYIITYAPNSRWGKDARPRVDVEFHRKKNFKEFIDISSDHLKLVCNSLKEIHPNRTSAKTDHDSIIVQFEVS